MNISKEQYAELTEFILEKSKNKEEAKESVAKLAKIIVANHDQAKIDEIVDCFNESLKKKAGIVVARVLSAKEISQEQKMSLKNAIAKKLAKEVDKIEVLVEIDESLIGGISIQIGDNLIDGSLKTKLEKLENSLL